MTWLLLDLTSFQLCAPTWNCFYPCNLSDAVTITALQALVVNVNMQPFYFIQELFIEGEIPEGTFWASLKFFGNLEGCTPPIPQIWSHYCERTVFSDWLIYLSGRILIRAEKTNSLLLNSEPFFLCCSLPAGCCRSESLSVIFPPAWCRTGWQRKGLYPPSVIFTHCHTFFPLYLHNMWKATPLTVPAPVICV